MIPVKGRHREDCMAVCLASVLEIPIEEIPDFYYENKGAVRWYTAIQKWLKTKGYHLYYTACSPLQFAEFQKSKSDPDEAWPPRGYWLGRIARVEWIIDHEPYHVVVMKNHRCVYSPDSTIKETQSNDFFLVGYYLFTPLDPAKFQYEGE